MPPSRSWISQSETRYGILQPRLRRSVITMAVHDSSALARGTASDQFGRLGSDKKLSLRRWTDGSNSYKSRLIGLGRRGVVLGAVTFRSSLADWRPAFCCDERLPIPGRQRRCTGNPLARAPSAFSLPSKSIIVGSLPSPLISFVVPIPRPPQNHKLRRPSALRIGY